MKLKVKRLSENALLPTRGTSGAAGLDFYASRVEVGYSPDRERVQLKAHTDIAVEIPDGYVGLVFPRSSVVKTKMRLANCVGVIDSDYRGEITAVFDTAGVWELSNYHPGDRVFQLLIVPIERPEVVECDNLSATIRGEGGYGSTGR